MSCPVRKLSVYANIRAVVARLAATLVDSDRMEIVNGLWRIAAVRAGRRTEVDDLDLVTYCTWAARGMSAALGRAGVDAAAGRALGAARARRARTRVLTHAARALPDDVVRLILDKLDNLDHADLREITI